MAIYIYPTDVKWFRFLQQNGPFDEVNFWQPGGSRPFTRLKPGELLLFRLKSPINKIAGGGVFTHGSLYPLNAAWDAFGLKNGVASYRALWQAIAQYREGNDLREDTSIGCIILQAPFFLSEDRWVDVPSDFHLNLVQGKAFADGTETEQRMTAWAASELQRLAVTTVREGQTRIEGPMFGPGSLVRRRLGQGAFRVLVSDAYDRRCAITGEKTLPVLEAAHIRPVSHGGEHRLDNGLLLRSDLHTLFDLGYVTVTAGGDFRVSSKLRETWMNGRVYYDLDKTKIRLPSDEAARPSTHALEWHNDIVFRA